MFKDDKNLNEDFFELEELKVKKYLFNPLNNSSILQREFQQEYNLEYNNDTKIIIIIQFIMYLLKTLLLIIIRNKIPNFNQIFLIRIFFCVCLLFMLLFKDFLYQKRKLRTFNLLLTVFLLAFKTNPNYDNPEEFKNSLNYYLEAIFNYLCYINLSHVHFTDIIIISLCLLFSSLITNLSLGIFEIFDYLFLIYAVIFFLHSIYIRINQRIDQFNNIRKKKIKKHAQNELIYQLLPMHVI